MLRKVHKLQVPFDSPPLDQFSAVDPNASGEQRLDIMAAFAHLEEPSRMPDAIQQFLQNDDWYPMGFSQSIWVRHSAGDTRFQTVKNCMMTIN